MGEERFSPACAGKDPVVSLPDISILSGHVTRRIRTKSDATVMLRGRQKSWTSYHLLAIIRTPDTSFQYIAWAALIVGDVLIF